MFSKEKTLLMGKLRSVSIHPHVDTVQSLLLWSQRYFLFLLSAFRASRSVKNVL